MSIQRHLCYSKDWSRLQELMLNLRQRWLLPLSALVATVAAVAMTPSAQAAQEVVLRYGIFRGSVPVHDLSKFAETGETSSTLRRYLRMSKQEPDRFRQFLTEDVTTDAGTLERLLNSSAGDVILNELSEYMYTTSRQDDREALRTALTTSAEDDNRLSFIELLEDYPADKIYINVRRVISTYREFASIQQRVGGLLEGRFDEILKDIHF